MNETDRYVNQIICGNSLELMRKMPSESIDLVVTSPPYNLKNSTGNGMKDGRGGKWTNTALVNKYSHNNDCIPHEEYVEWQHNCLAEMFRLIKEDRTIFYNHKWRVQGGLLRNQQDIVGNFLVRQIIIRKRNGGINFNLEYFLPIYEVIYLIPKLKFKLAPKSNKYGDVWYFRQELKSENPAPFPVKLIDRLKEISEMGFKPNVKEGHQGGIGNTLEDLLGIEKNNFPIPNAEEWKLKTQRLKTTVLNTLFHTEFLPRAVKFIPSVLLPKYGLSHKKAGKEYPETEVSFRQTIHRNAPSDQNFKVIIDRKEKKILISFNSESVKNRHEEWLPSVKKRVGNLRNLNLHPYSEFEDLEHKKIGSKLYNCFFVQAEIKKIDGKERYRYCKVQMLQPLNFDGFLTEMEDGNILVNFDAKTRHNHGTKFRLRRNKFSSLYKKSKMILDELNGSITPSMTV